MARLPRSCCAAVFPVTIRWLGVRNSDENETTPEDSRLEFLEEKHKMMTSLDGLLYERFILVSVRGLAACGTMSLEINLRGSKKRNIIKVQKEVEL